MKILAFLVSIAAISSGQNIVQPGAPGAGSKVLTPAEAVVPLHPPAKPDIEFMQGMIMHHNQAVEMTALMPERTRNQALLELGQRISISQTDEMKFMKQWLEDRGLPTTMQHHMDMSGMDMSKMTPAEHARMMSSMMNMMMPGMLTPEQMEALKKAKGATFDRLFLTGMIQHHGGALTMVQDLFNTPGAGQDALLFDFATDVDNTQRAEIEIMKHLLKEKK